MATTFCVTEKITEQVTSPKITSAGINTTMTRRYDINATSISAALVLLKATVLPYPTVDGILLNATPTLRLEPSYSPSSGVGVYIGQVEYRHPGRDEQTTSANELLEPFREKVSASFSGETEHITSALRQWQYPCTIPDSGTEDEACSTTDLAINAQFNGEVEGVDVYKRTGSFTVSTVLPQDLVDNEWLQARFKQIWTINAASFRSWPRGDVALVGMDIRQRSDGNWEIDYTFQISPRKDNLTSYAGIELFTDNDTEDPYTTHIKGWDYAWVKYRPDLDQQVVKPTPVNLYIAQVYEYSDFSQLGILT